MFRRTAIRKLQTLTTSTSTKNATHHLLLQTPTKTRTVRYQSTMELIKQLRQSTGAPMVECKKAISASSGDYSLAVEQLRKNGSAKAASKLAGRDASEGLVGIAVGEDGGSVVRVASETDFASRSGDFSELVRLVADGAVRTNVSDGDGAGGGGKREVDVEELLKTSVGGEGSETVKDALDDAVLSIRENLQIASATFVTPSSPSSVLSGYVHGKVDSKVDAGTAAALVELVPTSENTMGVEEIRAVGKKLAMHVVAARPTYLSSEDVPPEVVEKEKEILMEQMGDMGNKPPEIVEKILTGKMRKYYEAVCLTEQDHMVEEGGPKIGKLMKDLRLEVMQFESKFIQ